VLAAGSLSGAVLQPHSTPRMAVAAVARTRDENRAFAMELLLLEALGALVLLVGIVWWVMFAGRRKGERKDPD
jgi:hypothetical protein